MVASVGMDGGAEAAADDSVATMPGAATSTSPATYPPRARAIAMPSHDAPRLTRTSCPVGSAIGKARFGSARSAIRAPSIDHRAG